MDDRFVLDTLKGVSVRDPDAPALPSEPRFFSAADIDEFVVLMGGEHVWLDRGGWPIAISRGMFRSVDGRLISENTLTPAELASVLQQATIIGEYFSGGFSGENRITRRYIATIAGRVLVCDINRDGWRTFVSPSEASAKAQLISVQLF